MQKSNFNLDLRSFVLGLAFFAVLSLSFAFNQTQDPQSGRFQGSASDRGFLILDTASGEYIIDTEVNYLGRMKWIKGSFGSSFEAGVDKTSPK